MFQCKHNIHNEKVRIICDHVFFSFATRSAVMANPNISSVESLRTSIKREACSQECECPFVRCLWQYPPISIDLADLVAYDEGVSEEDRRHSLSEQPSTPAVCSNSHLSRAAAGGWADVIHGCYLPTCFTTFVHVQIFSSFLKLQFIHFVLILVGLYILGFCQDY